MPSHFPSNPPAVATPKGHFSQCVVMPAPTGLLFVSGQVPTDAEGRTVGQGSMSRQAEQVFGNLQALLAAHGATFDDALKVTIFVTRMDLSHELAEVRKRFFGESRPCSTLVGVATLKEPDWWLEVELIAALPQARAAQAG
jgi:enamine deaminase RidA (YjgF/YER057c/UK114 family)